MKLRVLDLIRRADSRWEFVEEEKAEVFQETRGSRFRLPSIENLLERAKCNRTTEDPSTQKMSPRRTVMDATKTASRPSSTSPCQFVETEPADLTVNLVLPSQSEDQRAKLMDETAGATKADPPYNPLSVQERPTVTQLDAQTSDRRRDQDVISLATEADAGSDKRMEHIKATEERHEFPAEFDIVVEAPTKRTTSPFDSNSSQHGLPAAEAPDAMPNCFDYSPMSQGPERERLSQDWFRNLAPISSDCVAKPVHEPCVQLYGDIPGVRVAIEIVGNDGAHIGLREKTKGVSFGNFFDSLDDDLPLTAVQQLSQIEAEALAKKECMDSIHKASIDGRTTGDGPLNRQKQDEDPAPRDTKFKAFGTISGGAVGIEQKPFAFSGFQSAGSGRSLQPSKSALAKAKSIFDDLDVIDDGQDTNERSDIQIREEDVNREQNVSSTNVKVIHSEAAHRSSPQQKNDDGARADDNGNCMFGGFQSAGSKRKWAVSEDSIARAKRLFESVDQGAVNDASGDEPPPEPAIASVAEDARESENHDDIEYPMKEHNQHTLEGGPKVRPHEDATTYGSPLQRSVVDAIDAGKEEESRTERGWNLDALKCSVPKDSQHTPSLKAQILRGTRLDRDTPSCGRMLGSTPGRRPTRFAPGDSSRKPLLLPRASTHRLNASTLSENTPPPPTMTSVARTTPGGDKVRARTGRPGALVRRQRKFNTPRTVAPPRRQMDTASSTKSDASNTGTIRKNARERTMVFLSKMAQEINALRRGDRASDGGSKDLEGLLAKLPIDSKDATEYTMIEDRTGTGIGWKGFHDAMIAAGSDPSRASETWVRNHCRWVVWKLARAELAGWPTTAGVFLRFDIVLDQLQRRYEREHVMGHQSPLKAIVQREEAPSQVMVLLIADVVRGTEDQGPDAMDSSTKRRNALVARARSQASRLELELTDGWYGIRAKCDGPLQALLASSKAIHVGAKIRVSGASLLIDDAQDSSKDPCLRLLVNGVRPMPCTAKLGRCRIRDRPTVLPLGSLLPGGPIGRTVLVILRKYPSLAWSQLPSGVRTFQTPSAAVAMQSRVHQDFEAIESAIRDEVHRREMARCKDILDTDDAGKTKLDRQYARVMIAGEDAEDVWDSLDAADRAQLHRYHKDRQEELAAEVRQRTKETIERETPAAIGASSVASITFLVGEVRHSSRTTSQNHLLQNSPFALLTVKPATEEAFDIKENEVYSVTDVRIVNHNDQQGLDGSFFHDTIVHLQTTKHTSWQRIDGTSENVESTALRITRFPRRELCVSDVASLYGQYKEDSYRPNTACNVFDLVSGIVVGVGECVTQGCSEKLCQWIVIFDAGFVLQCIEDGCVELEQKEASRDEHDSESYLPMLALQLRGDREAMTWLHREDEGAGVSVRDIEFNGCSNGPERCWRALGGSHSSITLVAYSKNAMALHRKAANADDGDCVVSKAVIAVNERPDVLKRLRQCARGIAIQHSVM